MTGFEHVERDDQHVTGDHLRECPSPEIDEFRSHSDRCRCKERAWSAKKRAAP
jgi:hypothetical protein